MYVAVCLILGIFATFARAAGNFTEVYNSENSTVPSHFGDRYVDMSVSKFSGEPYTINMSAVIGECMDFPEPDVVREVGISVIIGLVSFITIAGNAMVVVSVMLFRRLKTIPNMFILSLSVADLIMGGFVVPVGAHYVAGGRWRLGIFFCEIWTSVDVLSVTASIGTLCIISLDRFVAITMPFEYSLRMTRPRARCIIGAVWIVSAATAFVPILLGWWKSTEPADICCYNHTNCCEFRTNPTYAVVSSCISFYIPLFVMVGAYSIVFKIAIQQRSNIRNREGVYRRASMPGTKGMLWGRGEYRAIFTMGLIMGTFVICWLPFFVLNVLTVYCKSCVPDGVFSAFNWIGYLNSLFNPIIYCHSKEFRRAFKRILRCGLCRDGYRQTSRASLSVSYTPSASTRSSVRESSIYQLTSFFMGNRRRDSRMSTTSARSRRSPVPNGGGPPMNNNKGLRRPSYGYRFSSELPNGHPETASGSSANSYASESAFLPVVREHSDESKGIEINPRSEENAGLPPNNKSSDKLLPP